MRTQFYDIEELKALGIRFGSHVKIHRTVELFGYNLSIGSNVRIDCFSVITADEPVVIGNNVHIGVAVNIFGSAGVVIEDFCGLSPRCTVFTTSDDYSGGHLTNPTVPAKYREVRRAAVRLEKHAIIGCGSVIMPGVVVHRGASVGALSFVNKDVPPFTIVRGSPLRRIGLRNREQLETLEAEYEAETGISGKNPRSH